MTGAPSERDAALVARCLQGDEAAWEALVSEYRALVWSIALRSGLSNQDAQDVYQTVWRLTVEHLPRLRQADRFGRWVRRTTYSQAMRVLRDQSIARRALERIPVGESHDRRPADEVQTVLDRHRVQRALRRIGERCQELLRLLYFQSPRPSYAAIAERMGMRIGSIGPTRARCLKQLEERFNREPDR